MDPILTQPFDGRPPGRNRSSRQNQSQLPLQLADKIEEDPATAIGYPSTLLLPSQAEQQAS